MSEKTSVIRAGNGQQPRFTKGPQDVEILKIPYNVVRSGKKEDVLKGIFKTQFDNKVWSDHE